MKTTHIIMMVMLALLIGACTQTAKQTGNEQTDNQPTNNQQTNEQSKVQASGETTASQQMIKFESIDAVKKFLAEKSSQETALSSTGGIRRESMAVDGAMVKSAPAPMMADSAQGVSESASSYSQTNVQVAGVDEADIVKNDDRYIYMIADNNLIIIDAYDAKNADIIAKVAMKDNKNDPYNRPRAKELYVKANTLVLFVEENKKSIYFAPYDIQPQENYRQETYVYLYDITDKTEPKLTESFELSGTYFQSRLIDDKVYVVTQEYTGSPIMLNEPMLKSSTRIIRPDIYYFDNPDYNYNFNTITSIDITKKDIVDAKTLMLGYANTLMVSEDNIYIAYQKQDYWRCWYCGQRYDKERFTSIVVPKLEGTLKTDIQSILSQNLDEKEEWTKISAVLSDFFTKAQDDEQMQEQYSDMLNSIVDALEEYDTKKTLEERKTIIHKIGISDGKLTYAAKGEVYGSLLNQFSLDEYQGNLRVATTVNIWNRKQVVFNNVYVLDSQMKLAGKVEGIAKDESIFAARFLGNRLYMVTYKNTDPLFVIDLSSPTDPKIAGELKMPGFSNYLHPYDETHLIGVGKEADEEGKIGGVKVALFDVSDIANPELIDSVEIGDQGSDSPALYDHHAFLFSKEKNLLVLPVTVVSERNKITLYQWSNTIWNGAYVFKVTEDGITQLGKVKHSSSKSDYFYWWNEASVLRSLYMDNNLYTISNKYLKINDLNNELEELNSITLPYSEDNRYVVY